MRDLLVPKGTTTVKLLQFNGTIVDNGFVLNKLTVVEEAGKPPQQVQSTLVFKTAKEMLQELEDNLV